MLRERRYARHRRALRFGILGAGHLSTASGDGTGSAENGDPTSAEVACLGGLVGGGHDFVL